MKFFDKIKIEPLTRKIQDFIGLGGDMIWKMLIPENEKIREYLKEKYFNYCKENEICFSKVFNPSAREVFSKLSDMNIKIAIASSLGKQDVL
jgi:beta-phosphoglucomutase-like phosphatase (HAD superfamily)